MNDRLDVLRALVDRCGYTSYLEVGTAAGRVFKALDVPRKVGVDPDPQATATHHVTSDAYFAAHSECFDLAFIDGLHHAEQVRRDIENALARLRPEGTVVVHDVNPTSEAMQRVPRPAGQVAWTGDVWKTWVQMRQEGRRMWCLDIDHGVGLIRHGEGEGLAVDGALTYERLCRHRTEWLGLVNASLFVSDPSSDPLSSQ